LPRSHSIPTPQLYEDDADLRVPTMVFNALLERPEAL
jgi:hypothetical protein